jgi:hypothetical protein
MSLPKSKPASGRSVVRDHRIGRAMAFAGAAMTCRSERNPSVRLGSASSNAPGVGGGKRTFPPPEPLWNGSFLAGPLIRSEACCLVNMKAFH